MDEINFQDITFSLPPSSKKSELPGQLRIDIPGSDYNPTIFDEAEALQSVEHLDQAQPNDGATIIDERLETGRPYEDTPENGYQPEQPEEQGNGTIIETRMDVPEIASEQPSPLMEMFEDIPMHSFAPPVNPDPGYPVQAPKFAQPVDIPADCAFFYQLLAARRLRSLEDLQYATELNISSCKVSKITMKDFSALKVLVLADNALTSDVWKSAGIGRLTWLESLDIRNNKFEIMQMICDTVSELKNLVTLRLEGNPCYAVENVENRMLFVGRTQTLQQLGCQLKFLNKRAISIAERVDSAIYSAVQRDVFQQERFRLELVMESNNILPEAHHVDLSKNKFKRIVNIGQFRSLKTLNLSFNNLSTLEDAGLESLLYLTELNLKNNEFADLELLIDSLRKLHRLRKLNVLNNPLPNKSFEVLSQRLRGVEKINDEENPALLSDRQRKASGYLLKMVKNERHRIGANNLHTVDLSSCNLEGTDFIRAVQALSILPVESLKMNNNPWTKLRNYRLLVIYYVKTAKEFDGIRIDSEERANAIRVYEEFQERVVAETNAGRDGKQVHKASILKNATTAREDVDAVYVGTILDKFEIIINYAQMFSLLITNSDIGKVNPLVKQADNMFGFLEGLIPIDYNTFKILVIIAAVITLPLIFLAYTGKINRDRWTAVFVSRWILTLTVLFVSLVILMVSLSVTVYVGPSSWFTDTGGNVADSSRHVAFLIGLAILAVIYMVILIFGKAVRDNHMSDSFWYAALRRKRRFALFLMTVFYTPVNKLILQYLQTCPESTSKPNTCQAVLTYANYTTAYYTANVTVYNATTDYVDVNTIAITLPFKSFPFIWLAIIPLSLVTIFVLPAFFGRLIKRGVTQIYLNYGIGEEIGKLEKEKERLKRLNERNSSREAAEWKTRIVAHKELIKVQYAIKTRQHESAASYLYATYRINCHYWKILLMGQRLLLLLISVFVSQPSYRCFISAGLCCFVAVSTMITRPFSDPIEDLLETTSQITNAANALILALLITNVLKTGVRNDLGLPEYLLIILFSIFALASIMSIVTTPVRNKIKEQFKVRRPSKAADIETRDARAASSRRRPTRPDSMLPPQTKSSDRRSVKSSKSARSESSAPSNSGTMGSTGQRAKQVSVDSGSDVNDMFNEYLNQMSTIQETEVDLFKNGDD